MQLPRFSWISRLCWAVILREKVGKRLIGSANVPVGSRRKGAMGMLEAGQELPNETENDAQWGKI